MGCDIHLLIERRENGRWKRVPWTNEFMGKYPEDYPDAAKPDAITMPDVFDGRNYDLFGILADVRNGTWGAPNPPIAQPRGLPDDMDDRASVEDSYLIGDHSFTWVTLRELQQYPWDAPNHKRGWVSHEQAQKFRADGIPPTSYAAGGNHGEYIDWTEPIRASVHGWVETILPLLAALGEPDDVRLVFGFDN
jgi:hypothetical protein